MNTPGGEETILVEAQRLPPEERGAYLAQATGDNAVLRRRVEALLGGYKKGEFLEQAAAQDLRPTAPAADPLTESPGDSIGRYKLLQQIGEGGCGVVYMAEQIEPVRRRVALKIIKLGMDTKAVIARFEAERQALALMDHPNIAKVLDAGATETGRPYFVMELVRGMKITDYCDEAKLSTRARLDLFVEVCQAVQHAHQKGIIHRDLKPSNVLVTINDGQPVPKVIDFGVAKATGGQQLTDKTLFTAFEQFIGTPAYMSPEQAVLTSLDVDTRSDIYALGVLLYELLTGRTPFEARELLAIGLDEMRRTIREVEPARPSTRLSSLSGLELTTTAHRRGIGAPKLISELRGDLDWIVVKALEKDRARRYETANGLALDIQRHLNDEPVVACPPSRWYAFQKALRRHKLAWAASTAVFLALLIGLGASAWMFAREREAKMREREAKDEQARLTQEQVRLKDEQADLRQRADDQAADLRALNEFWLHDLLRQASSDTQAKNGFRPNPNLTMREVLERAAAQIGDRFKDQPLQEAAVRMEIGTAFRGLGQPKRAIPHHERGVALLRELDHPQKLIAMGRLARSYREAGMLHLALPLFEETLDLMKETLGADDRETQAVAYSLALAYKDAGKLDQALPLAEENLRWHKENLGLDDRKTLGAMNNLANMFRKSGRIDEGLTLVEETLDRMKKSFPPGDPWTLNAMANLANFYLDARRFDDALPLLEEVATLREGSLGPNDYNTLSAKRGLAYAYRASGDIDKALPLIQDIVNRLKETPGPRHPETLRAMMNLAETFRLVGNDVGAEAEYREALGHLRSNWAGAPSQESPLLGSVLCALAEVLRDRKKLDEAKALAEEAVAAYERHPHWGGDERRHAFAVLQSVLQASGDTSGAEATRVRYHEALKAAAGKGDVYAMNAVAWRLATDHDPAVRDGQSAVRLAEEAAEKTGRKDSGTLDTLAAAYAEAGDFAKAASVQREAIKLCQDDGEKLQFRTRLRGYESGKPYRDSSGEVGPERTTRDQVGTP